MKIEHFATSPRGKWPLGDSIADVEDIEAWQFARELTRKVKPTAEPRTRLQCYSVAGGPLNPTTSPVTSYSGGMDFDTLYRFSES
ncbi:MAG: hypothetical protein L6437_07215, partial [Kiritimatiellae bacterium]|nr:hypothetical protein [Kiritimatiellia bacterium]